MRENEQLSRDTFQFPAGLGAVPITILAEEEILLYIYLAGWAARGITMFLLHLLSKSTGLRFDIADALVSWCARLRGFVGLSMATIVHFSARHGDPLEGTGQRFMFHMGGVFS